jgi:hypothetical protein
MPTVTTRALFRTVYASAFTKYKETKLGKLLGLHDNTMPGMQLCHICFRVGIELALVVQHGLRVGFTEFNGMGADSTVFSWQLTSGGLHVFPVGVAAWAFAVSLDSRYMATVFNRLQSTQVSNVSWNTAQRFGSWQ